MTVAATGDYSVVVELGLDNGIKATADKSEDRLLGDLVTGSDAERAENTLAVVSLNRNEALLGLMNVLLAVKASGLDGKQVCGLDEAAVGIIVAAAFKATSSLFLLNIATAYA